MHDSAVSYDMRTSAAGAAGTSANTSVYRCLSPLQKPFRHIHYNEMLSCESGHKLLLLFRRFYRGVGFRFVLAYMCVCV